MKKKRLSHRFLCFLLSSILCFAMCACAADKADTSAPLNPQTSAVSEKTSDDTSNSSSQASNITESSVSSKANSSSQTSETSESSVSSKANTSSQTSKQPESSVISKASSSSQTPKTSESTESLQTDVSQTSTNTQSTSTTQQPAENTVTTDTQHTESTEPAPESTQPNTNPDTEEYYESEPDFNPDTIPDRTLPDKEGREKKIVVIDAGHQEYPNFDTEPIAPGASEMKIKVSGGTTGVATGIPEYELTLTLALKLQPILEERGYEVIQTRTTNDVDISNIERADVANNINADAFIRIHANGSDYSSVNGAMALCQTPYNPYNGHIYSECYSLSEHVLDELVASTGCNKQYIWETDTMCGINWSLVPVTIIEVGYMSNPQEDRLMADSDYQDKICIGIANGIDKFFE